MASEWPAIRSAQVPAVTSRLSFPLALALIEDAAHFRSCVRRDRGLLDGAEAREDDPTDRRLGGSTDLTFLPMQCRQSTNWTPRRRRLARSMVPDPIRRISGDTSHELAHQVGDLISQWPVD